MQKELENLKPAAVWRYFGEIMNIPRPSKHEERISAYLQEQGKRLGLETLSDELGNVLIRKPAHPGYEKSPKVCLQAHMDMVCEKNSDKEFDFLKDPIQPVLDGEWLTADGTTLGADDGIGVAAILAILEDKTIEHGPLEALFTVDEETGLTGAEGLATDWLQSEILLNFDDEDEGEFCIGCAGGIDTTAKTFVHFDRSYPGDCAYELRVFGLKGGHSGDDINKGLGNAIKMLTRILYRVNKQFNIKLSSIDGGNLRNAIAREAKATFQIEEADARLEQLVKKIAEEIRFEYRTTEPDLQITLERVEQPKQVMTRPRLDSLLNTLYGCPHGVLAMSREIPNFVETSTNLASVKMDDRNIFIATSQRSSVESAKYAAAEMVEAVLDQGIFFVSHGDGYPGWTPNPESKVLKVAVDAYRRLFKREPVVRAIHAGLECGLIGEKYPKMDMISFGPTLRGVHSPDERILIPTVQMFWDDTIEILRCLK